MVEIQFARFYSPVFPLSVMSVTVQFELWGFRVAADLFLKRILLVSIHFEWRSFRVTGFYSEAIVPNAFCRSLSLNGRDSELLVLIILEAKLPKVLEEHLIGRLSV
jgi:hypothetical protein